MWAAWLHSLGTQFVLPSHACLRCTSIDRIRQDDAIGSPQRRQARSLETIAAFVAGTRPTCLPSPRKLSPALNSLGPAILPTTACKATLANSCLARRKHRPRDTSIAVSTPITPPSVGPSSTTSRKWSSTHVAAIRSLTATLAGRPRWQPATVPSSWCVSAWPRRSHQRS